MFVRFSRNFTSLYKLLGFFAICLFFLALSYGTMSKSTLEPNPQTISPTFKYNIPSQKWIKEQLDKFYKDVGSRYKPPSDWPNVVVYQSYYFPNINIVFTGIPKTGCSHWKELFLQAEGTLKKRLEHLSDVHREELSNPHRIPGFIWNTRDFERVKTATSLVALRNPWVRAVSAYRQKLSSEKPLGETIPHIQFAILHAERNISADVPIDLRLVRPSFEEFVRYAVRGNKKILRDVHFKPQHMFLDINRVRYDYVIPMEFVEPLSTEFFENMGLNISLPGSYDGVNDPKQQTSVIKARELFSALDPDLVDKFYDIYKLDFKLLNYSNFSDPEFPFPYSYH